MEGTLAPFNPSSPLVLVVFFLRRSRGDAVVSTSTLRQLCSMLASLPERLRNEPNSYFHILHECCSSSAHPANNRLIFKGILLGQPTWVLTANPDRFTRRTDEVEELARILRETGGGWMTTGVNDDDVELSEWVHVEGTYEKSIMDQIKAGREKALQAGFYQRTIASIIRLLNEEAKKEPFPQLDKLRDALELCFKQHDVSSVLLCVRISPDPDVDETSFSTSLTRQQEFLQQILPRSYANEVRILRGKSISGYDGTYMRLLEEKLSESEGNVACISTSLERITRSADGPELLSSLFTRLYEDNGHRHIALSLLWDAFTTVDASSALRCPADPWGQAVLDNWNSVLQEQARAPSGTDLLNPIVQPIVWVGDGIMSSSPAWPHIERHALNSEKFVRALKWSSYQGEKNLELPTHLQRDDDGRGLDQDLAETWREFAREKLDIDQSRISLGYLNGRNSWACSCPLIGPDRHANDCQCQCSFCRSMRACPCEEGACSCPALCNCTCVHCHPTPKKTKKDVDSGSSSRICKTPGCESPAPSWGPGGLYCQPCSRKQKQNRSCATEECARRCATEGCDRLAPVGSTGGRYCGLCGQRKAMAKRAEKKRIADEEEGVQPKKKRATRARQPAVDVRKCAIEGCAGTSPLGGKYGKFCSAKCRRSKNIIEEESVKEEKGIEEEEYIKKEEEWKISKLIANSIRYTNNTYFIKTKLENKKL
ncbi:hypothetical protein IWX92DRAFT_390090 [Phyllosticta citricarpa]